MAFFILHHILFALSKISNPHLLLTESLHAIWVDGPAQISSHHNSSLKEEIQELEGRESKLEKNFLYSHIIIFIVSLGAFTNSISSLNESDKFSGYRRRLLRAITLAFFSHSIYLYTVNTVTANQPETGATTLKCIHTIIMMLLVGGSNWSLALIRNIGDTLTINFCLRKAKVGEALYHSVTYLMIGAFSMAFMSLSLLEIHVSVPSLYNSAIGYTNSIVMLVLLSLVVEFVGLSIFTASCDQSAKNKTRQLRRWMVDLNDIEEAATLVIGAALGKKSQTLSMAAIDMISPSRGELYKTVDEDEVDLFYICNSYDKCNSEIPRIQQNQKRETYDRSKFSLYDGFKLDQAPPNCTHRTRPIQISAVQKSADLEKQKPSLHPIEFLFSKDWNFLQNVAMLTLIGAFYQANQLYFLPEYLHYLLEETPQGLKISLFSLLRPFIGSAVYQDAAISSQVPSIMQMELICVCFLVQSLASVSSLQYINSIVSKFGCRGVLSALLIISSTMALPSALYYYLIHQHSSNLSMQSKVAIVIVYLIFVQILVGIVGSSVDLIITELVLQHTQQVLAYRTGAKGAESRGSQCTIRGILDCSFNLLGASLMCSICILGKFVLKKKHSSSATDPLRALISVTPVLVLLILSSFVLHIRTRIVKTSAS